LANTWNGPVRPSATRKRKGQDWIAGAIKKPGALHRELGVPQGQKIPAKTLATAAKAPGLEGKRARLAKTLKGFH
jgi:hypothetical protein